MTRIRLALAGIAAAILGAAPHLLHHAGPLAGAALLAGAAGSVLFGALGLIAAAPLVWRLRKRTGSWRWPGAALALMTAGFLVSTLVIGPAISGEDDESRRSPQAPQPGSGPAGHEGHHR